MVIAHGKDNISAFVVLQDDEKLPLNLNVPTVVVCRCGDSTNRKLEVIKPFGSLADDSILAVQAAKPICEYKGEPDGSPLHQHADGSWWFYEETWALENGPFDTEDAAYEVLKAYCVELQS